MGWKGGKGVKLKIVNIPWNFHNPIPRNLDRTSFPRLQIQCAPLIVRTAIILPNSFKIHSNGFWSNLNLKWKFTKKSIFKHVVFFLKMPFLNLFLYLSNVIFEMSPCCCWVRRFSCPKVRKACRGKSPWRGPRSCRRSTRFPWKCRRFVFEKEENAWACLFLEMKMPTKFNESHNELLSYVETNKETIT